MLEILLAIFIPLGILIAVPGIISLTIIPHVVFNAISKRTKPDKWSREHPSSPNPGVIEMWGESLAFRKLYGDKESEIETVTEDGLTIKGLYYDFGSPTAVIILGGRPETCIYSLYYAEPYAKKGINVCVFDPRAHGLSDGIYSGCGYAETKDLAAIVKVLEGKGIKNILYHGICVGSAAMMLSATEENRLPLLKGIFTDGLYIDYYETLKKRIRKNKGPTYPTVWIFREKIKRLYGVDCSKVGPLSEIGKLNIPSMMVASKEDIFSLPEKTQLLFDTNGSPKKKLEWFPQGFHSHLRRIDKTHYDACVDEFIEMSLK
ncbi:MAG: hypothetical protein K6E59_03105 [Bacilli bacterium]|nr:hypothetical protein [Bacilli bacterium]